MKVNLKKILVIGVSMILVACASTPKREKEWIRNGEVVSESELQAAKAECKYNEKMEKITSLMRTAISVGRYQTDYELSKPSKYTNESAQLMTEIVECMREQGLTTREKQ